MMSQIKLDELILNDPFYNDPCYTALVLEYKDDRDPLHIVIITMFDRQAFVWIVEDQRFNILDLSHIRIIGYDY